jgi:hypothetical protein
MSNLFFDNVGKSGRLFDELDRHLRIVGLVGETVLDDGAQVVPVLGPVPAFVVLQVRDGEGRVVDFRVVAVRVVEEDGVVELRAGGVRAHGERHSANKKRR